MRIWRPADANETTEAWRQTLLRTNGPSLLVLSRQNLPVIDRSIYASASGLARGAYILNPVITEPRAIIIATGSEVSLALTAAAELQDEDIAVRVVSMPSFELFGEQDESYQAAVLPPHLTARVVVEAGSRFGWERFVGNAGGFVTIDTFGASAPGAELMRQYGFTTERIKAEIRAQLART